MLIAPALSAEWIRSRLLRIALEKGNLTNREQPTIGIRLRFREVVPDVLLLNLRFELMIEVPEVVPETGVMRIGYRCPSFIVTDAMTVCSREPSCLLQLEPAPRATPLEDCHLTAFLTLSDEAAQYMRRDGTQRDWRNQVARVRFYHPFHRIKKRRTVKNPDYEPMQTMHVSTVWDAVPRSMQMEDTGSLEDYLRSVDDAFCEFGDTTSLQTDDVAAQTGN
ncbi:MAG: hypothetical protein WC866_06100 [Patescibacteria group bacterium]|jgi:hypothetical protein